MANIIQIKRSEVTATPSSLSAGELAYSEASNTLFIGLADGSVVGIAGVAFTAKLNSIEENANNYTHPTGAGANHIPAGGSSGQVLTWSADGVANWGTVQNSVTSVAGKQGDVTLVKADVGLDAVDNTADNAKNVATAVRLATPRKIANVDFDGTQDISIALADLVKDANNRAMTDTEKSQLQAVYNWFDSMTADDSDDIINTVQEIISAFSNTDESFNLASELANPTAMTLDGGTF